MQCMRICLGAHINGEIQTSEFHIKVIRGKALKTVIPVGYKNMVPVMRNCCFFIIGKLCATKT